MTPKREDRAQRPLVDEPPVEADRHDRLAMDGLVELARERACAIRSRRTTLIAPAVEPAQPPISIRPDER